MTSTTLTLLHITQLATYSFTLYYSFVLLKLPAFKRPGRTSDFDPGQLKYLTIWDVVRLSNQSYMLQFKNIQTTDSKEKN